jgi:thiol-disulfide isomerase/thioredoxin
MGSEEVQLLACHAHLQPVAALPVARLPGSMPPAGGPQHQATRPGALRQGSTAARRALTWAPAIGKLNRMAAVRRTPTLGGWTMRLAGLVLLAALLPAALPGADAPVTGLSLVDLDGKKVALDSLVAGGPVVLNFWATWCGPCRREMPELQKIYADLGPKGIQFCAVSLDRGMSKAALEQFLKKGGVTLPIYRDETGTLAKAFKVTAIPSTVVFAKGGAVSWQTKGYRPGDEILLRKKIEAVIVIPQDEGGAERGAD